MRARTIASVGFIAGGALATAGFASLVLWNGHGERRGTVAIDRTPSYVGIRGSMR